MQWCNGNSAMAPCDDDDLDLRTIGKKCKSLGHNVLAFSFKLTYDKVSVNTASPVRKTSKFQSDHRVVEMVLNTFYYVYLWHTK